MKIPKSSKAVPSLLCVGLALVGSQAWAVPPVTQPASATAAVAASSSSSASAASSAFAASIGGEGNRTGSAKELGPFNAAHNGIPGFVSKSLTNIKMSIGKKEQARGVELDAPHFGFASRPSITGANKPIALGTDNPESAKHYLMCIDPQLLRTALGNDCVIAYTPLPEHVSDTKWVNDERILCATGRGNLALYRFDNGASALERVAGLNNASGSYIREIALSPYDQGKVVIGGFDHKLNFMDLNRSDSPYLQRLDLQEIIGSIKWSPAQGAAYVSCTLDEGRYYMFDTRTRITDAAYTFDARLDDLFTHERYNDYNVLLGFGNGTMKHIDMRMNQKTVQVLYDPYTEAIGNIEFNGESGRVVASGYTDYTVWDVANGQVTVSSHSEAGDKILRGKGWSCAAVFSNPNEILMADCGGALSLTQLDEKVSSDTDYAQSNH